MATTLMPPGLPVRNLHEQTGLLERTACTHLEAGEALSEVSAVTQRQMAFCRLKALVTCFNAASLLHGSLLG